MLQNELPKGLLSLAERLGNDYYPLTELLCKNAAVQADWLNQQNATAFTQNYRDLYRDLGEMVSRHITMGRQNLAMVDAGIVSCQPAPGIKASQERIKEILTVLQGEAAVAKVEQLKEMHQNLHMKLKVIVNILSEIFYIECIELIPFFESGS